MVVSAVDPVGRWPTPSGRRSTPDAEELQVPGSLTIHRTNGSHAYPRAGIEAAACPSVYLAGHRNSPRQRSRLPNLSFAIHASHRSSIFRVLARSVARPRPTPRDTDPLPPPGGTRFGPGGQAHRTAPPPLRGSFPGSAVRARRRCDHAGSSRRGRLPARGAALSRGVPGRARLGGSFRPVRSGFRGRGTPGVRRTSHPRRSRPVAHGPPGDAARQPAPGQREQLGSASPPIRRPQAPEHRPGLLGGCLLHPAGGPRAVRRTGRLVPRPPHRSPGSRGGLPLPVHPSRSRTPGIGGSGPHHLWWPRCPHLRRHPVARGKLGAAGEARDG